MLDINTIKAKTQNKKQAKTQNKNQNKKQSKPVPSSKLSR
jgi:hypothetical protein